MGGIGSITAQVAGLIAAVLAVAGIAYQFIACFTLGRFFARPIERDEANAPVTLLKPLHGAEPRLAENLGGFLDQDYAGPVQMVCGLGRADDTAAPAVAALSRAFPGAQVDLAVNATRHGSNGKIGNLTNMMAAARHDVLVQSDSDMAVPRDYLRVVLGALARPGVGAVTCLYRGRADAGLWSVMGAGAISYVDLPGVVVSHVGALANPCMGSTIALRRETLAAIGGFTRFADVLADDYAIGQAVLAGGQSIAIPPMLLVHGCADASFAGLWRHQLRWAATVRSLRPWSYFGMVVINPLPWAMLTALANWRTAEMLMIAVVAIRVLLAARVDRIAGAGSAPLYLLPVIDVLGFAVFVSSFVIRRIEWRGTRLTIATRGVHGRIDETASTGGGIPPPAGAGR